MKKSKQHMRTTSLTSLKSAPKFDSNTDYDIDKDDILNIKIHGIKTVDYAAPKVLAVEVIFCEHKIIEATLKSTEFRHEFEDDLFLEGNMYYDPSDYERMRLFADNPLIVQTSNEVQLPKSLSKQGKHLSSKHNNSSNRSDMLCCYIDILPIFIDQDELCSQKRLRPLTKQKLLNSTSWDNLPLVCMSITAIRNPENKTYHDIFKNANIMRLTLVGVWNLFVPTDENATYTAATKLPADESQVSEIVYFNKTNNKIKHTDWTRFEPSWESLYKAEHEGDFAEDDARIEIDYEHILNPSNIDLMAYIDKSDVHSLFFGCFHRTLMVENTEKIFKKRIKKMLWPFELHSVRELITQSYNAYINLFPLLYPGVEKLIIALPLDFADDYLMRAKCGTEPLMTVTAIRPASNSSSTKFKRPNQNEPSCNPPTCASTVSTLVEQSTGFDGNPAFVLIEVELKKPFLKAKIPTHILITDEEINSALEEAEKINENRICSCRGQQEKEWQKTIKMAEANIQKIPYYGLSDFCLIDRQLSETRTRIEIFTSFWQNAAVYVNNNFIVSDFMASDESYEQLLMLTHSSLMNSAYRTIFEPADFGNRGSVIIAARHARQMQDMGHAMVLYFQSINKTKNCPDRWREVAVCMKDIDTNWSNACLFRSASLNPRHPLTLLCLVCSAFEEDPDSAEQVLFSMLNLHPFWVSGWIVGYAYYNDRQNYDVADHILDIVHETIEMGLAVDFKSTGWEQELGDWWDPSPLPTKKIHLVAADILLRLRGFPLADVCLSRALLEYGESVTYYHLLALCFRLRGDMENALCHLKKAIDKFGELSCLRTLQSECYQKLKNTEESVASIAKSNLCQRPYSILLSMTSKESSRVKSLLVDLTKKFPSAYTWIALAENIQKEIVKSKAWNTGDPCICEMDDEDDLVRDACACAWEALKWDNRAAKAWNILAQLTKRKERREYYALMSRINQNFTEVKNVKDNTGCYATTSQLKECTCCKICGQLRHDFGEKQLYKNICYISSKPTVH